MDTHRGELRVQRFALFLQNRSFFLDFSLLRHSPGPLNHPGGCVLQLLIPRDFLRDEFFLFHLAEAQRPGLVLSLGVAIGLEQTVNQVSSVLCDPVLLQTRWNLPLGEETGVDAGGNTQQSGQMKGESLQTEHLGEDAGHCRVFWTG